MRCICYIALDFIRIIINEDVLQYGGSKIFEQTFLVKFLDDFLVELLIRFCLNEKYYLYIYRYKKTHVTKNI